MEDLILYINKADEDDNDNKDFAQNQTEYKEFRLTDDNDSYWFNDVINNVEIFRVVLRVGFGYQF